MTSRAPGHDYWRPIGDGPPAVEGQAQPLNNPSPALVRLPGGDIQQRLQHDAYQVVDQLYSKLPEEGFFNPNLSNAQPIQFEIGSFRVPQQLDYWMFEYEFRVFRFSGVDPGDFIALDTTRFRNVLGFDILVNNSRMSNLLYQLDPQPIQTARDAFAPTFNPSLASIASITGGIQQAPPQAFVASAFNSFAAMGPGLSLLPADPKRIEGTMPFTLRVKASGQLAFNCFIFRTVPAPVAFIEVRHSGYLISSNASDALYQSVRPRW